MVFRQPKVLPRFLEGVALIRGVEANILNLAGDIDIPPQVELRLDWMIGSLHEPVLVPSTKQEHTQMLINAIEQGRIDALGHLGNPRFDFDFEAVIESAAKHHVAIEINNSSLEGQSRVGSKERCYAIAEVAKQAGAYITTGSDAHFCTYIGGFESAIPLLESVGVDEDKVITRSARDFLNFLRLRGHEPIEEFELHFWGSVKEWLPSLAIERQDDNEYKEVLMIRAMTAFLIGMTMAASVWADDLEQTMKQMKSAFRDAAQAQSVDTMKAAVMDLSTLVAQAKHDEYDGKNLAAYHEGLQELSQALDTVKGDLDKGQLDQAKADLRKVDDLRKEYHKKTR